MLDLTPQNSPAVPQGTDVRHQLTKLRAENERIRRENRELRAALDSYINRARSTAIYGPVEMTAGTCVGPRRRSPGGT